MNQTIHEFLPDEHNDHACCDHREKNHQGCSGHHHHVPIEDTSGKRLLITLVLNLIIPVIQVIGGVYAHSMALISDATHNFSDSTAIFISYIAYRIGKKGPTTQNTFGYRRAEIMAALLNVTILAGACFFILFGAFKRLGSPEIVSGKIVIWIAAVGIVGNGFSAWLLHRDSKHSLNVRGAFLHMMGDLLTSVAVLVNGVVLTFKPWYWLDPLLSILIVIFILKNCWGILKSSTMILMNATPGTIDLNEVQAFLLKIEGISGVHYLHAWPLGSSGVAFSCHLVVQDQSVSQTEKLSERVRHALFHEFGIDHPVFQFETKDCGNGSMLCEISCGGNQECVSASSPECDHNQNTPQRPILRYLYHGARISLGLVFIYASIDKIIHPQAFAQAVFNYQILPDTLINLTALVLPWLELVLGGCLIFNRWMPGAVTISTGLLLIFMGAIVFNLSRGLDISCGCFSSSPDEGPMNILTLIRDASFLIPAFYLFFSVYLMTKERGYNEN